MIWHVVVAMLVVIFVVVVAFCLATTTYFLRNRTKNVMTRGHGADGEPARTPAEGAGLSREKESRRWGAGPSQREMLYGVELLLIFIFGLLFESLVFVWLLCTERKVKQLMFMSLLGQHLT